nr:GFA family protein [Sphingomonas sp.]
MLEVTICHCRQCRRLSGHLWACVSAPRTSLTFTGDEQPQWYSSSEFAQRGFCGSCGSSLFYRALQGQEIAIAAGSLDMPTGLLTGKHIFLKDKGDYYRIGNDEVKVDRF